jgi:F420-0:gamma-glutamyl ligase
MEGFCSKEGYFTMAERTVICDARTFVCYPAFAMEFIPVQTRIMHPPKDDLFAVLDTHLADVREGDVVCVSSKVVAIHQGRCVPAGSIEKSELVKREAELFILRGNAPTPLTVKQATFIGAAGIDESNADGHYILMPEDLFGFARALWEHIRAKHALQNVGIIITDSRSLPLRYGATGVALAFWGFAPLLDHRGEEDLFGREIRHERSNLADGIAAGANVVMGEVAESTPIVIARSVPGLAFTEANDPSELFTGFEDDIFRVLYERFL